MTNSDWICVALAVVVFALGAAWTWWCFWGSNGDYPAGWP